MFVFSLFIFQHFVASCSFGNCSHCSSPDMKRLFPLSSTSIRKTLFFLAAATSSFTCREFIAKGFSHSTFFPASRNSRPTRQCSMCSTPTYTMSVKDTDVAQSASKKQRELLRPAPINAPHPNCLHNNSISRLTDVWVFGQSLVAAVSLRNAVPLGELLGSFQAPRCNGSDLCEVKKQKIKLPKPPGNFSVILVNLLITEKITFECTTETQRVASCLQH